MIDLGRLHKLLNNTTAILSKGQVTHDYLEALDIPPDLQGLLPGVAEWPGYVVDCSFLSVGVNVPLAQAQVSTLTSILENFPESAKLDEGPSFHHLAQYVGGKLEALRLIALGDACGLWNTVTPQELGVAPNLRAKLAALGFICLSGYPDEACVLDELAVG